VGVVLEGVLYRAETGVVEKRLSRVENPYPLLRDCVGQVFPCRGKKIVREIEVLRFRFDDKFKTGELGLRKQTSP